MNQEKFVSEFLVPTFRGLIEVPKFGLTAGLSVTLEGLIGSNGMIWGLNHFGYSAPYTVLDEKFGFTAAHVVQQVKQMLRM